MTITHALLMFLLLLHSVFETSLQQNEQNTTKEREKNLKPSIVPIIIEQLFSNGQSEEQAPLPFNHTCKDYIKRLRSDLQLMRRKGVLGFCVPGVDWACEYYLTLYSFYRGPDRDFFFYSVGFTN